MIFAVATKIFTYPNNVNSVRIAIAQFYRDPDKPDKVGLLCGVLFSEGGDLGGGRRCWGGNLDWWSGGREYLVEWGVRWGVWRMRSLG